MQKQSEHGAGIVVVRIQTTEETKPIWLITHDLKEN